METPVLEGPGVRLEPLTLEHLPHIEPLAFEPSIWRYMIYNPQTSAELRALIEQTLTAQATGTTLPWVIFRKDTVTGTEELVGATRFMDLNLQHRTTEIGNTWLTETWRGTRVNTEAKLLQLTFAFETLELNRVAFKAHVANKRSQSALRAIGAMYEGTFRNHYVMPDRLAARQCVVFDHREGMARCKGHAHTPAEEPCLNQAA